VVRGVWLAAAGPRAVTITGGGIQEATVVFRRVCTTVVMLWYCTGVVVLVVNEGVVVLAVVVDVFLAVVVLWEPDVMTPDGLLVAPAGLAATGLGGGRRVTEPVGK